MATSDDARRAPRRAPAPGQRQVDADRTRTALLDAALEEFAAKGFAGARVRDIAQRAGVSKDLVAYHFGGKDGLYLAVQQSWLRPRGRLRRPRAAPRRTACPLPARRAHRPASAAPARLARARQPGRRPARRHTRHRGPRRAPVPDSSGANSQPTSTPPCCDWSCSRSLRPRSSSPARPASSSAPHPDDPEFEARYASGLRRLIAHLTPEGRQ